MQRRALLSWRNAPTDSAESLVGSCDSSALLGNWVKEKGLVRWVFSSRLVCFSLLLAGNDVSEGEGQTGGAAA
jgi:hypothetical protein